MRNTPGRTVVLWEDDFGSYGLKQVMDKISQLYDEDQYAWITLQINSSGGQCLAGFALYDFLRGLDGLKLQTVGYGQVSSMAIIIFLAGEHRVAGPNCYFFLHQPTNSYNDKVTLDINGHARAIDALNSWENRYLKTIRQRLPKPPSKKSLRKILKKTKRVNAKEALSMGIVHEILPN